MADVVVSQGTEIFFIDPSTPTAFFTMECPTSVSKSGGARNMIEILCLNSNDPEFRPGSRTATTFSVPFALVPTAESHQALFDLEESGVVVPFLIALSDGTADPTVTGGEFTAPTGRSSLGFDAVIEDVAIDIATNDVVRGTLTLRQSGPLTKTWKS